MLINANQINLIYIKINVNVNEKVTGMFSGVHLAKTPSVTDLIPKGWTGCEIEHYTTFYLCLFPEAIVELWAVHHRQLECI